MIDIVPNDLSVNILIWFNDILLHASTVNVLLESVRLFFALCVEYNIKLHPVKFIHLIEEGRWGSPFISCDSRRYDPRIPESLLFLELATTGAHL